MMKKQILVLCLANQFLSKDLFKNKQPICLRRKSCKFIDWFFFAIPYFILYTAGRKYVVSKDFLI